MKNKITLVTGNRHKLEEDKSILGFEIDSEDIDLPEIQSLDVRQVIEDKVISAYKEINNPVFCWDISFEINSLNGFPGPLVKWFIDSIDFEDIIKIVSLHEDRTATVKCVLGYHDGNKTHFYEGVVSGKVPKELPIKKGWGWDSLFIPEGKNITYAEIEKEELLKLRPHFKALMAFSNFLNKISL